MNQNLDKKKILIIAPQTLPVPATKGGAVETLLTDFIMYNERLKRVQLFIVTKYGDAKNVKQFKMARFFFFESDNKKIIFKKPLSLFLYICWRLFKKLFNKVENVNYNFFGFYVNRIAHRIHPDIALSEGYDKITRLWQLSRYLGSSNCYYHLHYSKIENLVERQLFPNTITPSKFVQDLWCLSTKDLGNNIIVHNGINLDAFSKNSIDLEQLQCLKNKLGIQEDDFIVIFVGRFRPGKGLIELFKAFDLLQDKNIKLLLVGDFIKTCFDESEFENSVVSYIKTNKSIIHVGRISQKQLPYYYALSNIQVVPSICQEAAGLVAIEGMSFGLPIIATKSGGLPEYIHKDCSIQLCIDEELPLNISIAIMKLKLDPGLRTVMSASAKDRSVLFSNEKYCVQLMNYLCYGK